MARTLIVKKGLDIPLMASPKKKLPPLKKPFLIALNLAPFEGTRITPLVDVGASVKIGTPIAANKKIPGQYFVSPASGIVCDVRRGLKRVLTDIVIQVSDQEEYEEYHGCDVSSSREDILAFMLRTGMFAHIRKRPFNQLAHPDRLPSTIFIQAIESLPFVPSAEMQVEGNEDEFAYGLATLQKLSKSVFFVTRENSPLLRFGKEMNVCAIRGPHPSGDPSIHIHHLSPIDSPEDTVWTLTAWDVVVLGTMMKMGRYFVKKILSVGGDAVPEEKRGFVEARLGCAIGDLLTNMEPSIRLISGDPLTGKAVQASDFVKFGDSCVCAFPESETREPLHFLSLGLHKYSMHRAYASGHMKISVKESNRGSDKKFAFTTSQHGEERPFIDGSVYDQVMPMQIPTMPLMRAILAEDFELAQQLGLLEVVPEDFALASFICPSKIDMIDIVKKGIKTFSKELEE